MTRTGSPAATAVAGTDGNLRPYDVAGRPARQSAVFAAHSSGAGPVAFAPGGHTPVSAAQCAGYFPGLPHESPCAKT